MSEYRLSEQQAQKLDLVPTTWDEVESEKINMVYIRAHSSSPVYGPYKIQSATECIVSKLDGSEHRQYPRDKGLLIPRRPRKSQPLPGKVWYQRNGTMTIGDTSVPLESLETVGVIRDLIKVISMDIADREKALDKLYAQQDILKDLLDKFEQKQNG